MNKIWLILTIALLLVGCKKQHLETVSDSYDLPASSAAYTLAVALPEDASQPTMDTDTEKLYICENFSIMIQQLEGGDLKRTLQEITGMQPDALTVMKTSRNGAPCYQWAWSAVGEGAHQSCRTLVLDDGKNHHAVTVMADHRQAGDLAGQWQHILDSVELVSTD